MIDWRGNDRSLLLLPAAALDETHVEAMQAAWMLGAWDVAINTWPPQACQVLHMPWAAAAYEISLDGGVIETLDDLDNVGAATKLAAQRFGMIQWRFRPLAYGPRIRRLQEAPDVTLAADYTRALPELPHCGPVPEIGAEASQHDIQLGRA